MRLYEAVIVFDPKAVKSEKEALVKVDQVFEPAKPKVVKTEVWGERQLAYQIQKKSQGWYLWLQLELDESALPAVNKNFNLETAILRHLLIKQ